MNIFLNSKPIQVADGATLFELMQQMELPERGVAVAVDNKMVQRESWQTTTLTEEAKILVIKAACGG